MARMMLRVLSTALAGAALTAAAVPAANAAARPGPGKGLDAKVQERADKLVADGAPGVIVMTRRGGRVAHVTAGVSDKATGAPMDARLLFRIASVTKTFTSTVVLQLAAEHRLSLDDTVDRWLPGLVGANGNDGSKITVRQLLGQTSGLNDYTPDPRVMSDPSRSWKPEELIAIATEKPPLYAPGTGWNYSNTNYILAGMIIEKVTRHPVGTEFQRRIFTPLHLRHTSYPTTNPGFPGPYVHGYYYDYGDVSTAISPSSARTSGGIVSTVDDVARFHRALFTGRLLPAKQMREMRTVRPVNDDGVVEDYGLGAARIKFSCGYAWGHDGGFPGYRTWTYTSADGRRQAIVTYNESKYEYDETFRADLAKTTETAFCG
ncbi:serine hydrolase domain-containing protein [Actinomadura verrucosospora]|uniref:Penicillin-binding protein, beta-lactamase class C n=1 Tax=Actinomadura verrucosospora TaxID=46165 RepID=A0A7D3ZHU8_ACTVE|nr:serine hydrolase domain-containing protein [Actinomadura verrucosospora]QKG24157.1 penicillin-binding protein, beta-lactamase class C [Actinomadura verrucosospora]